MDMRQRQHSTLYTTLINIKGKDFNIHTQRPVARSLIRAHLISNFQPILKLLINVKGVYLTN